MKRNILRIALITLAILLILLIAMQFTTEVNWTLSDFVIMGVLLFGTGLLIDLALRRVGKRKVIAVIAILVGFLYIWAELAVGIFTNLGS